MTPAALGLLGLAGAGVARVAAVWLMPYLFVLSALLFDLQLATRSATELVSGDRDDLFEDMRRWLRVDPSELAEQIHAALQSPSA